MAYTLNDNLKRWAEQYETAEFIQSDPVQIPHRYDSRVNIEISAFVTAWIAWGSRKQIIQKADFIDREIFKGAPYHYIVGTDTQGAAPEWKQYKGSKENFYRTFTYADFHDLCARLFDVYMFTEVMFDHARNISGEIPEHMPYSDIICVASRGRMIDGKNRQCLEPCPVEGKTNCLTTVEKDNLLMQRPHGYNAGKIYTDVADLSIADVLKMQLFYDNAAAEVREIWESREKARKELKATERLKAHPIDGLHNAGLLEPGEFVVTFAKVLDKRETKLSRAERDVIHIIGMTAFNKTMQKLIADEKARNNSDGNNKQ